MRRVTARNSFAMTENHAPTIGTERMTPNLPTPSYAWMLKLKLNTCISQLVSGLFPTQTSRGTKSFDLQLFLCSMVI